jgi:hypothetical protein
MRSSELFVVRAKAGELRRVRGRIPKKLLDDLADVLARAGIATLELRAVVEDGRPKMYASGAEVPRAVRQQLRNVVGQWQIGAIRRAPQYDSASLDREATRADREAV